MQVFVFGNPDIEVDSLPVKLLPALRETFPDITFETLDPNEEWDVPEDMVVIDTVVNTDKVTLYDDLKAFMAAPRLSCHDFDAYANMMLMMKLGKIQSVHIIGIPPGKKPEQVLPEVQKLLKEEY
jgi:hypothetical protein